MQETGAAIRVRGQVQGVGYRPFVWKLAQQMALRGEVLNDAEGVLIRVAPVPPQAFLRALRDQAPPLARVEVVETVPHTFRRRPEGFVIAESGGPGARTRVTPDAATCPDCLAEIMSPGRRQGYAFTNCTHCGPRFSILKGLPYDRERSSMAAFALCPNCAAEYANPADRRFHAQPIACPACGPRLWFEAAGREVPGDPIAQATLALRAGRVLAVRGLGGFHLACDAANPAALALLRARKRRPSKPFALMGSARVIAAHALPSEADWHLLRDPAAPVVLVPSRGALPEAVAPGMRDLGVMLPYTPVHHLLIAAFDGMLVMTSGNLSGEPQVIGLDEARAKLGAFADGFLMHDREIVRRLDDGVERSDPPMVLRRGRGRVPGTQPLPPGFETAPQVIAFGAEMKAAICLLKDGQAMLSHHLGDLGDALTLEEYDRARRDYAELFGHQPVLAACDLHPGFQSTRRAEAAGLPVVHVQHHHAHMAAAMAENLWPLEGGPVAAIVLDGLGLGSDGTLWGGEILLGDYLDITRIAHLRAAPLPGGDRAQAEPWRNAVMRLDQAGLSDWADALFPDAPREVIRRMALAGVNAPLSSSAGRLFDAAAAVLGLCPMRQSYEGEAAMRLEALAREFGPAGVPGFELGEDKAEIDPAPLFGQLRKALAAAIPPGLCAARFHAGLAEAFIGRAARLVETGKAEAVALSGGCFQNAMLTRYCLDLLHRMLPGVPVLAHRLTPAGDGGIALGQAMIAAARHLRGAETE